MSGMFDVDASAHAITIVKDGRTVFTSDGTLVNLLPAAYDFVATVSLAYPDFTKDYAWGWQWYEHLNFGAGAYTAREAAITYITAIPQDFATAINLVAAPAGADIFVGRVRLNRTTAPANTWAGSTVDVLPIQNQWIPFNGSMLVESELEMQRAFSLYVSGGNLVLHIQQSVGVEPGGFGYYGNAPNSGFPAGGTIQGGEIVFGTVAGLPLIARDTRTPSIVASSGSRPGTQQKTRKGYSGGSPNPPATSDTTNYASTYSLEIVGSFGRRS